MDVFSYALDSTSTTGQDTSIFEIIAQEKMNSLLHPAFDQLIAEVTERNNRLLPLYNYRKIIYLVFMSGVQLHYLTEWSNLVLTSGGSFAETFYGLKRVARIDHGRMKANHLYSSLFELVIYPFIKSELDSLHNHLDSTRSNNCLVPSNLKKFARKAFIFSYPLIRFLEGSLTIGCQVGYIYKQWNYTSPWQLFTNLAMVRITAKDYVSNWG